MNTDADQASRRVMDASSWKLCPFTFSRVNFLWGPVHMDLFADFSNHQPCQVADLQQSAHSSSSSPAISAVVCLAAVPLVRGTASSSPITRATAQPRRAGTSNAQHGDPDTSSIKTDQLQQTHSQLSEQAAHLIEASWRRGTQLTYTSCWRRWERWCHSRTVDPFPPTLTQVLNFLASLFKEGLAYRTIGCYCSALSQILHNFDGCHLGEHPLVVRLMKGVFNPNPPQNPDTPQLGGLTR
ncbi:uncharacterized protein ISCGN_026984 [Ixodes scapularis]